MEFHKIGSDILLKAIGIILISLFIRWVVSVIVTRDPKLTNKESLFLAFAWIPKATV